MRMHTTPASGPKKTGRMETGPSGTGRSWWSPLTSSPRHTRIRTHLTHAHVPAIGLKAAFRLIGLPLFFALTCVLVAALSLLFATVPPSP